MLEVSFPVLLFGSFAVVTSGYRQPQLFVVEDCRYHAFCGSCVYEAGDGYWFGLLLTPD